MIQMILMSSSAFALWQSLYQSTVFQVQNPFVPWQPWLTLMNILTGWTSMVLFVSWNPLLCPPTWHRHSGVAHTHCREHDALVFLMFETFDELLLIKFYQHRPQTVKAIPVRKSSLKNCSFAIWKPTSGTSSRPLYFEGILVLLFFLCN